MNKIFNEPYYPTSFFSNEIFVKCPKCGNPGKIITKLLSKYIVPYCFDYESKFICLYCSHYLVSQSNKWYGKFIGYIGEYYKGRACSICGSKIWKELQPTLKMYSTDTLKCLACNQEKEYEIKWYRYIKDEANDPYFGMELLLKAEIRDNLIWFYNFEHLNYIKKYILSDIRNDSKASKYSLIFKLPKFIKLRKNQDIIIKNMQKLEKEYKTLNK